MLLDHVYMFEQRKYLLGVSRYRYVYIDNTCGLSNRTDIDINCSRYTLRSL